MEKIDVMLARQAALETMITATALAVADRAHLRRLFDQGVTQTEAMLLNSRTAEEFVQTYLSKVQALRALIAD